jgi:hypothetical protein
VLAALHIAHGTEPSAATNGLDLGYVGELGLLDNMPRFASVAISGGRRGTHDAAGERVRG